MTWTQVTKPTSDDWTTASKPSESSVVTFANDGQPFGLLIAITKDTEVSSLTSGWGTVTKPISSVWSILAKPTS